MRHLTDDTDRVVHWLPIGRFEVQPGETELLCDVHPHLLVILLNIAEQFYALAFQTLQEEQLAEWLGKDPDAYCPVP